MIKQYCTNCGGELREGVKFCSVCGIRLNEQQMREQNTEQGAPLMHKKGMSKQAKGLYTLAGVAIFASFLWAFVSHIGDQPHPVIEKQQTVAMYTAYTDQKISQSPVEVRVQNGKIIIPLSVVLEKKIVEFEYDSPTTVVPLLAYISNEGKLVTSIRFCEPCNSKSFEIESKELLCGNCTTRWSLNNLKGISGSCQKYPPAPIPSEIVGNEIQIDEKYAREWRLRI